MGRRAQGSSTLLQRLVIVLLLAWVAAEVGAAFFLALRPDSRFGFEVSAAGVVTAVSPGSAAADARIVTGDRVLLNAMDPTSRGYLFRRGYKPAGTTIALPLSHGGTRRDLRLTARALSGSFSATSLAATALTAIAFVGIALVLVLSRPSIVTWTFYLFACGYIIVQFGGLPLVTADVGRSVYAFAEAVALAMTIVAGSTFLLRFPSGTTNRSGAWLERAIRIAALAAVALYIVRNIVLGDRSGDALTGNIETAYDVLLLAILASTAIIVLQRHYCGTGEDRARGRWVLAGTIVGLGALIADFVLMLLHATHYLGSPLQLALRVAIVCIPLSVGYAVMRHRVIDVRFAVNRALAFAILTTMVVLAFSLLEWSLSKELEATRLALYAEIALALVLGFSFDYLKRFVDRAVERVFFQRERAAAERLRRAIDAVPHAGAPETVDELVTAEPLGSYRLTSAAVFRRIDARTYKRSRAYGWDGAADTVTADDPLIAYLAAKTAPLALDGTPRHVALPHGAAQPVVAVPIGLRRRLFGFVLYGPHESGETLDPEERGTLGTLAMAAATAYDHLEALSLRKEVRALRGEMRRRQQRPTDA